MMKIRGHIEILNKISMISNFQEQENFEDSDTFRIAFLNNGMIKVDTTLCENVCTIYNTYLHFISEFKEIDEHAYFF